MGHDQLRNAGEVTARDGTSHPNTGTVIAMRALVAAFAVIGCGRVGFVPNDVAPPEDEAQIPIDALPAVPICDLTSPSLAACYRFEGSGLDSSSNGNHAVGPGVTFEPGRMGQAGRFASAVHMEAAEATSLDLPTTLTLEAWLWVEAVTGTRAIIFDNDGQYSFFIRDTFALVCNFGVGTPPEASVTTQQWVHVACTYDATTVRVFVDGVERANAVLPGTVPTTGLSGSWIGADNPAGDDTFTGLIDELAVYSVVRTPAQLCADAGC